MRRAVVTTKPAGANAALCEGPPQLVELVAAAPAEADGDENRVGDVGERQRVADLRQRRRVDDDHLGVLAQLLQHGLEAVALEHVDEVRVLGVREEQLEVRRARRLEQRELGEAFPRSRRPKPFERAAAPKTVAIIGRRRSASIRITLTPVRAIVIARFTEVIVLPSPGIALVTRILRG